MCSPHPSENLLSHNPLKVALAGLGALPEDETLTPAQALDLRFHSTDTGDEQTIRDYLKIQLSTLWGEGEGFSGKRPLGNSGWENQFVVPLVDAGLIKGTVSRYEEDGEVYTDVVSFDQSAYDNYVQDLIEAL